MRRCCRVRRGDIYLVESGALARFQVVNLSDVRIYLYFITIVPTGRLLSGYLLEDTQTVGIPCLEPHRTGAGRIFSVNGLPGSVIETRIFCSPQGLWGVFEDDGGVPFAIPLDLDGLPYTYRRCDEVIMDKMQMVTVFYRIPEDASPQSAGLSVIEAAFA